MGVGRGESCHLQQVKLEEVTLSEISQRKAILQDIIYVSNLFEKVKLIARENKKVVTLG